MKKGNKEEQEKEERAKEFLKCLGNGKTIYQIEAEEEDYGRKWNDSNIYS